MIYKSFFKSLALTIGLFAVTLGIILPLRPLSHPDEGRYAEIPREMMLSGDYVTPRLNGIKYFEKPPLLYWLQAGTFKAVGISDWSARLWTAIFACFGVLITALVGRRLFGEVVGLSSAWILSTSLLYLALGQLLTLDMTVSICMTWGLGAFILGLQTQGSQRRRWLYGAAVALALGVLAKGWMSLALPVLIVLAWLGITRSWTQLRPLYFMTCVLVFCCVALPWHFWAQYRNPEFFDFYIIHEHVLRYLTSVHRRVQPFWFFIPVLFIGLFPWSGALISVLREKIQSLRRKEAGDAWENFLWLWAVIPFVFFSLSQSKLIPYILPIFPPLAILLARYLKTHPDDRWTLRGFQGMCVLMAGGIWVGAYLIPVEDRLLLQAWSWAFSLIALAGALSAQVFSLRWRTYILGGTMLFLGIIGAVMAPAFQKPSMREIAQFLNTYYPNARVITYHAYFQDLPPYLGRLVTVADWHGELDFGQTVEDTPQKVWTHEQMKTAWKEEAVCIVTRTLFLENLEGDPNFQGGVVKRRQEDGILCNTKFHF